MPFKARLVPVLLLLRCSCAVLQHKSSTTYALLHSHPPPRIAVPTWTVLSNDWSTCCLVHASGSDVYSKHTAGCAKCRPKLCLGERLHHFTISNYTPHPKSRCTIHTQRITCPARHMNEALVYNICSAASHRQSGARRGLLLLIQAAVA